MPYMDWHIMFNVFGLKLIKCNECGSLYIQYRYKTTRIWGKSCLKHSYRHTETFK
jgi:hypothetical protein